MKKTDFLLFIFASCSLLTIYNFRSHSGRNEKINKQIIEEEKKALIETTKINKNWTLVIAIAEIIISLLVFYIINFIFKLYDKDNTKTAITKVYKENISQKFKHLAKNTLKEPIKYLSYQDNCTLSAVLKSGLLNLLNLSFYWLLLGIFNGFKSTYENTTTMIKKSFKDLVYDHTTNEYYDLFYGLYQNYYLEDFCKINRSVSDLCENLKLNKVNQTDINTLKETLSISIVERKKNKNNYPFLVGLTCLSGYLYADDAESFKNYLKTMIRFKFSLMDILKNIQKHQKITIIRKKMVLYSKYSNDLESIEKAINIANNNVVLQLVMTVFVRGCFQESESFVSFLREIVIESIFDMFSSFITGTISDFTNTVTNTVSDIFKDSLFESINFHIKV